jgi:dihydrolipoamide dehydrogenase
MAEINKEIPLLVIGGGPGGYPAALAAADHGVQTILVDSDPKLGGVCLNRGCIPSKALLHVAKLLNEAKEAEEWGIHFEAPKIDLAKLAGYVQTKVVGRLTGGIGQLCRSRGVETIRAKAIFEDAHTVRLEGDNTGRIKFQHAIISTGSVPAMPKPFALGDPRIMDSTGALLLPDLPKRLLIIGGGYIGLEIGTVYAALGSKVTVVEFTDGLLPTADRDLVKPLEDKLKKAFEAIYLNTKVASLKPESHGIVATLEGKDVPASETFDRVLVSVGRRPNSTGIGLEAAGVKVNERGFIPVDAQRRTNVPHLFAIGDVAGEPGLAHKATAEAKIAVETILGHDAEFAPRAIPAVVFTDPEIAWAGLTEREAKEQQINYDLLEFPWAASGRAVSVGRIEGKTKILCEPITQRVLGVGIVGVNAGEMIAEAVLALEMGAVARDIAESIHPHPTLTETIMEGAELAFGSATHFAKKRKVAR